MARRQVISTGKDVASAIIRGLNELGRRRDQVDVTVLQKPSKGFLGIGAKKARVQIVEKAWDSEHSTPMRTGLKKRSTNIYNQQGKKRRTRRPRHFVEKTAIERPEKANELQKLPSAEIQNAVIPDNVKQPMTDAKNALAEILNKMGIKVNNLNAWWDAKQERILLTFNCDSPALVIGKEAKTLQSIQYLITLMISRSFSTPISVVADTQNYWNKLEEKLNKDISFALSSIRRNKRPYRFRPMSAQMRRYIHHFLADEKDILTVSEGEGKWRKVVLKIATPAEKAAQIAAEKAAAEKAAAEQTEQPSTETTDCVLTAESTNCPTENLAETQTAAQTIPAQAEIKTEIQTETKPETQPQQAPQPTAAEPAVQTTQQEVQTVNAEPQTVNNETTTAVKNIYQTTQQEQKQEEIK